jgi:ubiquinol-cytochrome c reductase iron-sulfur subunit
MSAKASAPGANPNRRRVLVAATSVVGAIGAGFALVPFIASMNPSAKARAAGAPVEADISKLEPGALLRVKWRGKPIWIVHRTPRDAGGPTLLDPELADPASEVPQQPEYCQNPARSIKPQFFVAIGICTHLGCSPTFRPEWRRRTWAPTGRAAFSVPATAPASTWPAASTRAYRHPPTW